MRYTFVTPVRRSSLMVHCSNAVPTPARCLVGRTHISTRLKWQLSTQRSLWPNSKPTTVDSTAAMAPKECLLATRSPNRSDAASYDQPSLHGGALKHSM